jgi:hypothetical protein
MDQNFLTEVVTCLTQSEKKEILEVSQTTLFSLGKSPESTKSLLRVCLNTNWNQTNFDKEKVFSQIFPNQSYVQGKIEKLMVDVHKFIKAYLQTKSYLSSNNNFSNELKYAEILWNKNIKHRHNFLINKLQIEIENNKIFDLKFYENKLQLENRIHYNLCILNQGKGDLNITKLISALDEYYFINKISIINRFLLQQKLSKIKPIESISVFIKEELPLAKNKIFSSNFIISAKILEFLASESPLNEIEVLSLFHEIVEQQNNLDQETLSEFFAYLRNICVLSLTNDFGNIALENVLHTLYKDNLERGLLHYEQKLHRSRYWAVSSTALRVGETSWAKEFIEKYKNELIDEDEEQSTYYTNMANYYFQIKDFDSCLSILPQTHSSIDYHLTIKRIELKSMYELKSDLLSYRLDAFKMYLSRTSPQ